MSLQPLPDYPGGPPGEATMMAALELTMWLIIGIAAVAFIFYLAAIFALCRSEARQARPSQSQRSRPTQPLSAAPAATGSLAPETIHCVLSVGRTGRGESFRARNLLIRRKGFRAP
jgi:hypothetical protein